MPIEIQQQKSALRARLRAVRRAMTPGGRAAANREINRLLCALPELNAARQITAYRAFDGEPDLQSTIEALHDAGKSVLLPVIGEGGAMHFSAWAPGQALKPNALGIDEPGNGTATGIEFPLVVAMPLVAWDDAGNRLGMGAGYYDRFLAGLPNRDATTRVGVAYACQRLAQVPAGPQDVPLDLVVTETGVHRVRR